MSETGFIHNLAEALSEDATQMRLETDLDSLAGWDSMGKVAVIALLDESYQIKLPPGAIHQCRTVADLYKLTQQKS